MKCLREYQRIAVNEAWDALKKSDDPVLLEASVGSGKSLMISFILKTIQDQNKRALCLVNSSELVRSNSLEFEGIGGIPSIFCASLNKKEHTNNIIFATPQSIMSAIKCNHPIMHIVFNMIVVDEAHGIGGDTSIFMKILRHYKQQYNPMRTLGLTGTSFRGSTSIVGPQAFFKTKVGNICTQYLIERGFLVPPVFGYHKIKGFDFSKCKPQNTGEFKGSELQAVIDSKKRLTWEIMQEVQEVMQEHSVCMVFCSTRKHCFEALAAIPEGQGKIILGDTPDDERNEILTKARNKEIKYLFSVNCLLTGINVQCLDLIVWLRPTSSLLLYIQGIGRGLRLYPGKKSCTVLDYASNIERFGDFDDPIINEAIQPKIHEDPDFCIPCYQCHALNLPTTRRCLGVIDGKRCDYYFLFKDCYQCATPNDQVARECRSCGCELIDPNAKLSKSVCFTEASVTTMKCTVTEKAFYVYYITDKGVFGETFHLGSTKAVNIFYGNYVRKHVDKSSRYYMHLSKPACLDTIAKEAKTPKLLKLSGDKIKGKVF